MGSQVLTDIKSVMGHIYAQMEGDHTLQSCVQSLKCVIYSLEENSLGERWMENV